MLDGPEQCGHDGWRRCTAAPITLLPPFLRALHGAQSNRRSSVSLNASHRHMSPHRWPPVLLPHSSLSAPLLWALLQFPCMDSHHTGNRECRCLRRRVKLHQLALEAATARKNRHGNCKRLAAICVHYFDVDHWHAVRDRAAAHCLSGACDQAGDRPVPESCEPALAAEHYH